MPPPPASCQQTGGMSLTQPRLATGRPLALEARCTRQTSDAHHRLYAPTEGRGHNKLQQQQHFNSKVSIAELADTVHIHYNSIVVICSDLPLGVQCTQQISVLLRNFSTSFFFQDQFFLGSHTDHRCFNIVLACLPDRSDFSLYTALSSSQRKWEKVQRGIICRVKLKRARAMN